MIVNKKTKIFCALHLPSFISTAPAAITTEASGCPETTEQPVQILQGNTLKYNKKNTNLKVTHFSILKNTNPTRMHSSRMRTARSLTVSRSIWWGVSAKGGTTPLGLYLLRWGVYLLQMYLPEGCTCPGDVPAPGVPALGGGYLPSYSPPTYRILDTTRKYYLAPNFVCGW